MIINPEVEEILQQLPGTIYGQALVAFLELEYAELNNLKTIKSYDELLGRQYAEKVIEDLFKFMGERKVVIKSKNQYI